MNDSKIVMYMHAGSGNHGCEAIVNSVCHMVNEPITIVSYYGKEDQKYTLKDLCEIKSERRFENHKLAHILYYGYRKVTGDAESFIRYRYAELLKGRKMANSKNAFPLAISIGGDNYCYANMLSDLRLTNNTFRKMGSKTILLGCSIEPELIIGEKARPEIVNDLLHYHTIIARESITYHALKEMIQKEEGTEGLPQLYCYPDPAFTLGKQERPLPDQLCEKNIVGINISPMIQEHESRKGIAMESYVTLIQHILDQTDMQVALIPHVVWDRNDDRRPIHELYEKFRKTGRVAEIPDGSCEELKADIARCRFFVGARTHATIAAYSSQVPTLVVGYSVKAKGIARDLFGTEEHLVLPIQKLEEPGELVKAFGWLMDQEEEIKAQLKEKMPGYQAKAKETGKLVDHLWEEFSQQQKI